MMSHKTIGLVTRGLGGLKLRTISRRKYKSWQHSGSYSHISLRDVNLYIWVSWRGGWDLAASKTYLMISRCSTQFRDKAELLSNFPINWPAIMIRPYQSGLLGHDLIPEDIFRIFSCLISEITILCRYLLFSPSYCITWDQTLTRMASCEDIGL